MTTFHLGTGTKGFGEETWLLQGRLELRVEPASEMLPAMPTIQRSREACQGNEVQETLPTPFRECAIALEHTEVAFLTICMYASSILGAY